MYVYIYIYIIYILYIYYIYIQGAVVISMWDNGKILTISFQIQTTIRLTHYSSL